MFGMSCFVTGYLMLCNALPGESNTVCAWPNQLTVARLPDGELGAWCADHPVPLKPGSAAASERTP